MSTRSKTMAALVLAAAVGGCASDPAAPLDDELANVKPAARAIPVRLAIAPLEIDPQAALRPADEEERWSPVEPNRARLRNDMIAAVKASGAFAEVAVLELPKKDAPAGATAGALPERAVYHVDPPRPAAEVLDAAFAQRADLVATFTVRRHAVHYKERNGWFVPNLVNFFTWVWTAWFVADEQYVGELEIDAVIRATGSQKVVFRETLKAAPEKSLDHFDRGWMFTGVITVPGWLEIENYQRAAEVLIPHARNEVATALATSLTAISLGGAAIANDLEHSRALCVGVGRYARVPDLRVATDDAKGFASLLVAPERGGLPSRNVVLLTDREDRAETLPTRDRIVAALDRQIQGLRDRDAFYFYFSGYAFEHYGEVYLAPNDLDPRGAPLRTALPLSELGKRLERCPARQVVILDTSFGGEPPAGVALRTLRRSLLEGLPSAAAGAGAEDRARSALERFANARKGRVLLLAAEPGAPATEQSPLPADKKGLFTARLIDAASADATDRDRDGRLAIKEVFDVARAETSRLSARAGLTQTPVALGDTENVG